MLPNFFTAKYTWSKLWYRFWAHSILDPSLRGFLLSRPFAKFPLFKNERKWGCLCLDISRNSCWTWLPFLGKVWRVFHGKKKEEEKNPRSRQMGSDTSSNSAGEQCELAYNTPSAGLRAMYVLNTEGLILVRATQIQLHFSRYPNRLCARCKSYMFAYVVGLITRQSVFLPIPLFLLAIAWPTLLNQV